MGLGLEQFVKQLEESAVLSGETLRDFLPPHRNPQDAEDLARELVRQKKLTKYQFEQVWQGNGKGLVLDNYILLEKIGEGGMGQVFKARHRKLERIVAVKILAPQLMKDPATIARFEREVRAAARINHPNIVTAFDAGQSDETHFLVMEYVEGGDLSALVKKGGPLKLDQALDYIKQTAQGLQAAHLAGIVHRDIKPGNLLIEKSGVVKILDMGLARIAADADLGAQAELTHTGVVMGTVDFMAPEQALDTKTADARADIYGLGCALHYLLAGRAIYAGDTLVQKLLAHRDAPIPSLRALRPEIPEAIDQIFRKMVAKRADERYQTMAEVLADLERASTGQPLSMSASAAPSFTTDAGLTEFFQQITREQPAASNSRTSVRPSTSPNSVSWNRMLIGGGAAAGVLLIVSLCFALRSRDGTLDITVNEDGATVQVIAESGRVAAERVSEGKSIRVTVPPGQYELKVEKSGFVESNKQIAVAQRKNKSVEVKLRKSIEKTDVKESTTPDSLDGADESNSFSSSIKAYYDNQKKLAEWLVSMRRAQFATNKGQFDTLKRLPPLPWVVESVTFLSITDEEVKTFVELAQESNGVIAVTLHATGEISRVGLEYLSQLKSLKAVALCPHGNLALEDVALVADYRGLQNLSFADDLSINDEVIRPLHRANQLEYLGFNACAITVRGVELMAGIPNLHHVYINSTALTDDIWEHFQNIRSLTELHLLGGPSLTGAGIEHLQKTRLKNLRLAGMAITPDTAKKLAQIPSLTNLTLDHLPIGDELVLDIVGPKLLNLYLSDLPVTAAGLTKCARKHPQLSIHWQNRIFNAASLGDN